MPSETASRRLHRILRQPTVKPPRREWVLPGEEDQMEERFTVSLPELQAMVASLDDEDRKLAAEGKDPGVASESAMENRASRFGSVAAVPGLGNAKPTSSTAAKKPAAGSTAGIAQPIQLTNAEVEAMKERESRWGTAGSSLTVASSITAATSVPVDEATLNARASRFQQMEMKLSPEEEAAMQSRAARFQ